MRNDVKVEKIGLNIQLAEGDHFFGGNKERVLFILLTSRREVLDNRCIATYKLTGDCEADELTRKEARERAVKEDACFEEYGMTTEELKKYGCYKRRRKKDGANTYIMTDGSGLYKIGRSKDPEKRLVHLRGGNPRIELLAICREDIELLLHKKYVAQNVYLEWFQLSQYEVDEIIRDYKFIRYPKRQCNNTK